MKQRVVITGFLMALAVLWLDCAHAAPRVSVVALAQAAEKGRVKGQFQLISDAPVKKALTVSYAIGGSAKVGKDYKKLPGKARIPAGQSSATVNVIPIADKKAEKTEMLKLALKKGRNYQLGSARSASIQITDEALPGGGGGTFPTYQNGSLPGRLLVGTGFLAKTRAAIFDLRTGTRVHVPNSTHTNPDNDEWGASANGSTVIRQTWGRYDRSLFSFFDPVSAVPNRADLDLLRDDIYTSNPWCI